MGLAVVSDEPEFPEFVHEEIDPGPRCAKHLRQHPLRHSSRAARDFPEPDLGRVRPLFSVLRLDLTIH